MNNTTPLALSTPTPATATATSRLSNQMSDHNNNNDNQQQPHNHNHNIDSEALERELMMMVTGNNTNSNIDNNNNSNSLTNSSCNKFLDLFQSEISRVSEYITKKHESQVIAAKVLLSSSSSSSTAQIAEAESQLNVCIELEHFILHNIQILLSITNTNNNKMIHFKELQSLCNTILYRKGVLPSTTNNNNNTATSHYPWNIIGGPLQIMMFSDIYHNNNAKKQSIGNNNVRDAVVWKAPSSFERSTDKYWIEDNYMTELLSSLVKEAPLLIYGWKGELAKHPVICNNNNGRSSPPSSYTSLWHPKLATKISSIYFDSPNMDLYKERIKRSEGAQLFRVRWYGDKKPVGDEHLFLELKTHHEKWINTKSIKERVSIRERDMITFLSPRQTWTMEDAERMVLAAQPNLKSDNNNNKKQKLLIASTTLLFKIHTLIHTLDLRPVVRSTYSRLAFQPSHRNDLRLTVDRNVVMIDERSTPRGKWTNSGSSSLSPQNNNNMAVTLPYAVFEVKLSGGRETPASIQNLINEQKIIDATKFSKFLTGAAAFNQDKIHVLPYWADFDAFKEILFNENLNNNKNEDKVEFTTDQKSSYHHHHQAAGTPTFRNRGGKFFNESRPKESSPPRLDKNNNINDRWSLFQKDRSPSSNNNNNNKKVVMAQKRVRVEPKTFFANERTFIQWVSAALFQVTIAVLLLEMGAANMTVSMVMVAFSAIIIMYSMAVYYRRLHLLSTGEAYGYIDHGGPIFLASSVLVGVFILLFHLQSTTLSPRTISRAEIQQSHTAVLAESSKQCYRHSLDTNPMDFQANDLFLDNKRGFMLIPTGSEITAVYKHNNNYNNKFNEEAAEKSIMVLANIPGSDFEAITYTPNGRIFAIREMKNSNSDSQLLEFDWNKIEREDDNDNQASPSSPPPQLELKQIWTIESKGAEGIAWVHDKKSDKEYLYIASDDSNDSKSDRGEIQVYNIPYRSSNEKKLKKERSLNRKLINSGLKDSKIASLQFFEGLLYVLHDNARVVRAWDISTGNKKFEFELPLVDGGYSKQWEGIALERRNNNNRSRSLLRQGQGQQQNNNYPSDSSLVLHLALDTPAQIWTLAVSQDESSGQIVLPSCAMP